MIPWIIGRLITYEDCWRVMRHNGFEFRKDRNLVEEVSFSYLFSSSGYELDMHIAQNKTT